LYTRHEALNEGELPVPLKLLHINRCPVIAPMGVLRSEDQERLQLDMTAYQSRAAHLSENREVWQDNVLALYGKDDFTASEDPEQQLYDGFINDRDRRLCEQVRLADPGQLARDAWPFDDARLPELLFRYRARNFQDTLSREEQQRWQRFCQDRLRSPEWGAPNTLQDFTTALIERSPSATPEQLDVLRQWQDYAQLLSARLQL
ncbi:exodeoxyribonuclease I, partial [Pseudomonas syringae]|nr:exodeoxyribonuclease I [Pseudomonas syringae]